MLTLTPNEAETKSADISSIPPPGEPTRLETFSKTAAAAKMSGTFNEAAGFFKRELGKLAADSALEDAGRNQQLFGKAHRLVGSLRSARDAALDKMGRTRLDSQGLCRKFGGRLLDGASEFIDELKKVLLK